MNPRAILKQYAPTKRAFRIVLQHSEAVMHKALLVSATYRGTIDKMFIEEAALLHDIGVYFTATKKFGCTGREPYIKHGILGGDLLRILGYPRHARVAERHIGVGITRADIKRQYLPLPEKDFVPKTLEEQIICYADKFFTKGVITKLKQEKKVVAILKELQQFGSEKTSIFLKWHNIFSGFS